MLLERFNELIQVQLARQVSSPQKLLFSLHETSGDFITVSRKSNPFPINMHAHLGAAAPLFLMGCWLAETLSILVLPAQECGRLDQVFVRQSRRQALENQEYCERRWII